MTRGAVLAVFLLVLGCDGSPAPADGGADADAPRDAGADAGGLLPDGGAVDDVDAGPDAGPRDPRWIPVPGLPEGCAFEAARDASEVEPLRFEPCPDRDGCRQVVVDWPLPPFGPRPPDTLGNLFLYNGSAADEEHAYFAWRLYQPDEAGQWHVHYRVSRHDGGTAVALRVPVAEWPHPCRLGDLATTTHTFAASVLTGSGTSIRTTLLRASFSDDVADWASQPTRPTIDVQGVQVFTSDTTTSVGTGVVTYRVDRDGGVNLLIREGSLTGFDAVQDEAVLGTRLTGPGWAVIRYPLESNSPEEVLAPADGYEYAMGRPSGGELRWVRLRDPVSTYRYAVGELWTSPLGTDGMPLSPRMVARLPEGRVMRSFGSSLSMAWVAEDQGRTAIYDIASGSRRIYSSRNGLAFAGGMILAPHEVGSCVYRGTGPAGCETFEFIEYSALPLVPVPDE